MKTFRVANSGGSSGGTSGAAPQTDLRFAVGSGQQANATNPSGSNTAFRVDIPGATGQLIAGQPGTPAPSVPQNGITQLSSGFVNMFYQPSNGILLGQNPPVFPTSTGVNGAFIAPCGYRCGFQSDTTLVNLVWEQSDTSEDRAYVRQMKVDVTNATPAVTLGGSAGELESGTQVTGDAIINLDSLGNLNQVVRTKFDFVEGDLNASGITAGDLGVDSSGKGGGLLVVYAKTTAATGGTNGQNGSGFSRDIIAVEWDGSTLSNRTVIGRGVFEGGQATTGVNQFPSSPFAGGFPTAPLQLGNYITNTGGPAGFTVNANGLGESNVPAITATGGHALHASLQNMTQVPTNPSLTTAALSPKESYIYFKDVNGDNADTGVGLYTRTFNHAIRATPNSTASFGDQFVPAAGTAAFPPSADFVAPQRMDHMTGGDVTSLVSVNVAGTTSEVTFFQDGHVWLSGTTDGATQPYTNDGKGSADPFLVDNDTSASTTFAQVQPFGDATCGNLHHSIFFFGKNDLSQTNGSSGSSANAGNGGGVSVTFNSGSFPTQSATSVVTQQPTLHVTVGGAETDATIAALFGLTALQIDGANPNIGPGPYAAGTNVIIPNVAVTTTLNTTSPGTLPSLNTSTAGTGLFAFRLRLRTFN